MKHRRINLLYNVLLYDLQICIVSKCRVNFVKTEIMI